MCIPNKSKELPIETLRELLSYDPDTGELTWKRRNLKWFKTEGYCATWNRRFANKLAKINHNTGCKVVTILNKRHLAHRVAFAIHYGYWPDETIDHINGDRSDNRIVNLRDVSHAENNRNQAIPKSNTSGIMGVSWHKATRKWRAQITIKGKKKHIGVFTNKQDAIQARKKAEVEYGYHANHGRNSISEQSMLV